MERLAPRGRPRHTLEGNRSRRAGLTLDVEELRVSLGHGHAGGVREHRLEGRHFEGYFAERECPAPKKEIYGEEMGKEGLGLKRIKRE